MYYEKWITSHEWTVTIVTYSSRISDAQKVDLLLSKVKILPNRWDILIYRFIAINIKCDLKDQLFCLQAENFLCYPIWEKKKKLKP